MPATKSRMSRPSSVVTVQPLADTSVGRSALYVPMRASNIVSCSTPSPPRLLPSLPTFLHYHPTTSRAARHEHGRHLHVAQAPPRAASLPSHPLRSASGRAPALRLRSAHSRSLHQHAHLRRPSETTARRPSCLLRS